MKKKIVVGILAHVDAGKTTLSESLLYQSGTIGKLGRVDKKDAYLDTYELEKARGITIFSKQAELTIGETQVTLLDTPGHVDFSSEMERTLSVLDYAILVISGADGVQGHTKTLWSLLTNYKIPVFLFVNKMDQEGCGVKECLAELKEKLSDNVIECSEDREDAFYDTLAMCSEELMEQYLETGAIQEDNICQAIRNREVFPCYFGSALRLLGIEVFMRDLDKWTLCPDYPSTFGARIFKIARDEQGNRLTYLKITGGTLQVRDFVRTEEWEEKVTQIRIYSGSRFEAVGEASAGDICAVMGLSRSKALEGLGFEQEKKTPFLQPVLSYRILLPEDINPRQMMPKLLQLEEEEPSLSIVWEEESQHIQVKIMGEIQLEILKSLVEERYGVSLSFGDGQVVYRETIQTAVEGVGHFEPLRHYAEVHLLLEPKERGFGLAFDTVCSEEMLARNWQNLVLTHLGEKVHRGVLTGAEITDMKITLVAGRAHNKHTEGGDFREATYRALRQGLMEAESILLEPYYGFQLTLPKEQVGRAMHDIEKRYGSCELTKAEGDIVVLSGRAPVAAMQNYQREVMAYTKGLGRLFCSFGGYEPCHNESEVRAESRYDPERDIKNPSASVFCSHGAGFLVAWDEVKEYMHVESIFSKKSVPEEIVIQRDGKKREESFLSLEEIDQIFSKTFYANTGKKTDWRRQKSTKESDYGRIYRAAPAEKKERYLLVDGYNIIHAWTELSKHVEDNMDGARERLLEILSNYQGIRGGHIIAVFDAYRRIGHKEEVFDYHNIHLVFTREAQTADQYIEKFAHENGKRFEIVVATSDGLQQMIVRGAGCQLMSARELREEIERANELAKEQFVARQEKGRSFLLDQISEEIKEQIKDKKEE
ncbi:MAG: ribosomal protection tetracycline resistance protein [Clostridiales bacterium]|nr:ribosomal protection tetracycline resistance protein [Clostridiales bacterium]